MKSKLAVDHPDRIAVQHGLRSERPRVELSEHGALTQDLDVDVCVIGGGLAGLTVAREVARRRWSVALLETHRLAWGASGHNAGLVVPGFAERPDAIVGRVGLACARELWGLSLEGVGYVRAMTEPSEPARGLLRVSRTRTDALKRDADLVQRQFGADARLWPTAQVRDVLRTSAYFEALHWPSAFQVAPLEYALGLAAAAAADGAKIFERTPAVAVDSEGVRKHVKAPNGRVRARHLVLAGGPYLGTLLRALAGTTIPTMTYLGTTAPLPERLTEVVGFAGAIADTRPGCDFYRIVEGDRLLWGWGMATLTGADWGLARRLARRIAAVYPQLSPVTVEHASAGLMSLFRPQDAANRRDCPRRLGRWRLWRAGPQYDRDGRNVDCKGDC